MSVLHLVPFRSGSKGIPAKSTKKVNGISLAVRAINFGLSSATRGPTLFSSDSVQMLRAVIRELGFDLPKDLVVGEIFELTKGLFLHYRSTELALDQSPIGPLIAEATARTKQIGKDVSHVVLLQPTSPFRTLDDSKRLASLIELIGPADSAVSVVKMGDSHPARMYRTKSRESELSRLERIAGFPGNEFSPRQALPNVYLRDGAFYIVGSELAKQGRQLGASPLFFERSWPYTINIDAPRDLEEARRIARKFNL